uniref:CPSF_A domain-containing protein n=1 Tax=Caenorhabditis tropicalis TaxID=1561998 RepID=A0A1I7USN5_9PELO
MSVGAGSLVGVWDKLGDMMGGILKGDKDYGEVGRVRRDIAVVGSIVDYTGYDDVDSCIYVDYSDAKDVGVGSASMGTSPEIIL